MFEKIIAIAGVPRSGTSWLGQIVDSSPHTAYRFQPLFSYAFKDAIDADSDKKDFQEFFEGIYTSADDFLLQTDKRTEGLYPTFRKAENPQYLAFKTCRYQYLLDKMLRYFENLNLLGIVRHPCATINSWLKNQREFPKGADPRKEWRSGSCRNEGRMEEFFGFYKWREVAHLYLDLAEKYPQQVKVIQYESLVDAPISTAQEVFDFLGLAFFEQTRSFLEACHSVHLESPYAVFKDKAVKDKWQFELDRYIADEIIQGLTGTRLERFLE